MATRSLGSLTLDLVAKTGGFEQGMDRAARSMQRLKSESAKQQNDLEKLLGKIDPVVGRLGELDKMEQQLAAHRKANRLPADDYAEYLGKLNAMRDGLTGATAANDKYTMSAKAQAAALRGVPAQFTDIVTSLQGGQAPLTVFLQQGGQLKDMFGGAGPAARALGGYVAGLVNPFTVAAGAAALLALAYKQGSDEQDAYRQALITTGNAAGLTTSQMAAMAKSVSATVGTTSQAADALTKLAATGKIPADQFEKIAQAAIRMNKATGKAVEDTISEFAAIADDPTKAISKLNESYNFLTAATYQQIKALQDEGNQTQAQVLAWEALDEATDSRGKNLIENLGTIQSLWKGVAERASEAWNAILDVGREQTLDQKLTELQERLSLVANAKSAPLMLGDNPNPMDFSDDGAGADAEWKSTLQKFQDETEAARKEMFKTQNFKSAKGDFDWFKDQMDSTKSKGDKLADVLEKINKRVANARAQGFIISDADVNKLIAQEQDKYKEKAPKKVKAYTDDEATRLLLTLKQQGAALEEQLSTTGKIGPKQRELLEFEQRIADLKEKKTLTADQKSLLASQDKLRTEYQTNAALEKRIQLQQEDAKIAAYRNSLSSQLQSEQDGYAQQLAGLGQSDKDQQRIRERLRAEQQYQRQLRDLTSKAELGEGNGGISQRQYQQELADLDAYHQKSLASSADFYKQQDEFNADWVNGARSAFANYEESAANMAAQTKSLFQDAFNGAEDALTNFVKTGKLDFKSLADSIITDLIRIQVRQALVAGISSFTGSATGQSFMSLFSKTQAMGGAWGGGVQMFANGGAFTNQVVSTPTAFGMAGGRRGLMGEAGPEAVMPLTRTADGSLGVKALAGAGVGGATNMAANFSAPQQVFHINGDVSPETVQMIQAAGQQAYTQAMRDIQKDITRNGPLTRGMRAAIAGR